jgi:hypothetical protein
MPELFNPRACGRAASFRFQVMTAECGPDGVRVAGVASCYRRIILFGLLYDRLSPCRSDEREGGAPSHLRNRALGAIRAHSVQNDTGFKGLQRRTKASYRADETRRAKLF